MRFAVASQHFGREGEHQALPLGGRCRAEGGGDVKVARLVGGERSFGRESGVAARLLLAPIPKGACCLAPLHLRTDDGHAVEGTDMTAQSDAVAQAYGSREGVKFDVESRALVLLHAETVLHARYLLAEEAEVEVAGAHILRQRVGRHHRAERVAHHLERVEGFGLTVEDHKPPLPRRKGAIVVGVALEHHARDFHPLPGAIDGAVGEDAGAGVVHPAVMEVVVASPVVLLHRSEVDAVGSGRGGIAGDEVDKTRAVQAPFPALGRKVEPCRCGDAIKVGILTLAVDHELHHVDARLGAGERHRVLSRQVIRCRCERGAKREGLHRLAAGKEAQHSVLSVDVLEACIVAAHAHQAVEAHLHLLHVAPRELKPMGSPGIEALRIVFSSPSFLFGRILTFKREFGVGLLPVLQHVEEGGTRFLAIARQVGFGQGHGLRLLAVSPQMDGQLERRLGVFRQVDVLVVELLPLFGRHRGFSCQRQFHLQGCPAVAFTLVEIHRAAQHPLIILLSGFGQEVDAPFLLDGEEQGAEQVVAIEGATVFAEVEERQIVRGASASEALHIGQRGEQEGAASVPIEGVTIVVGTILYQEQASQGILPQGVLHGACLLRHRCFDEREGRLSAVGSNLLLHHRLGEQRTEQLRRILVARGTSANVAHVLECRLWQVVVGGRFHRLPLPLVGLRRYGQQTRDGGKEKEEKSLKHKNK